VFISVVVCISRFAASNICCNFSSVEQSDYARCLFQ
jgi:hypothetical protein